MIGGRHTRSAVGYSRRRDGGQRNNRLWLPLGCVVVLSALICLFAVRGIRILNLQQQLQSSLLAHDDAMIERLDLENQLARKDDLAAIEDAVREQLGWVMPGEERVIFVDRTKEPGSEGE